MPFDDSSLSSPPTIQPTVLSGWKDIANYLSMGVRTVQRYECKLAFPVHRPAGKSRAAVIATKGEIDAWIKASSLRSGFSVRNQPVDNSSILNEFRLRMMKMQRLVEQGMQLQRELTGLRKEMTAIRERLHMNRLHYEREDRIVQLLPQRHDDPASLYIV